MTHLARLLTLICLAVPTAALAEGYSGTITGPNGGTASYSGSCETGAAGASCTRDSLLTGPKGHTATRKLDREITESGISTRVTTTGENGRIVTRTRAWSR